METVLSDSPAYEAGMEKGDEIVYVDGKKVEEWNDILEFVGQSSEKTAEIGIFARWRKYDFDLSSRL